MQLTQDRAEGHFFVRTIRATSVVVVDRELHASFLIAPDQIIENWPVADPAAIGAKAIQAIVELEPEVVILGTGLRQEFPPTTILIPLLRIGIGVEVMDNGAAGRTFNLLAAEGRRVVAAFILPERSQALV